MLPLLRACSPLEVSFRACVRPMGNKVEHVWDEQGGQPGFGVYGNKKRTPVQTARARSNLRGFVFVWGVLWPSDGRCFEGRTASWLGLLSLELSTSSRDVGPGTGRLQRGRLPPSLLEAEVPLGGILQVPLVFSFLFAPALSLSTFRFIWRVFSGRPFSCCSTPVEAVPAGL